MTRWSKEVIEADLRRFVATSNDLSEKAWKRFGGAASGTVKRFFFDDTFSMFICEYATEHGDTNRAYAWPICPRGKLHRFPSGYWSGTISERAVRVCSVCDAELEQHRRMLEAEAAWKADIGIFDLPPANCSLCSSSDVRGRHGNPAFCHRCRITFAQPPGSLVPRIGGGTTVPLEQQVVEIFLRHGLPAAADLGVVVPAVAYHHDIIKPDIVILDPCLAVEIDNSASEFNRHLTAEGAVDDRRRDAVLADVGWPVLRIRRPGSPIEGAWPRRVESTSQTANVLAKAIIAELGLEPTESSTVG